MGVVVKERLSPFLTGFSTPSASLAAIRPLSPSLKALTLTGATVGMMTEDGVALVIGVIDGRLEAADLDVAGVDVKDVLEDFRTCD